MAMSTFAGGRRRANAFKPAVEKGSAGKMGMQGYGVKGLGTGSQKWS